MKNFLETDPQKLLEREAERGGMTADELRAEGERIAERYQSAAHRLGSVTGISGSRFLETLFRIGRENLNPGVACLRPKHVETLMAGGEFPGELHAHVAQCAACRALIQGARLRNEREEQFIAQVGIASAAPVRSKTTSAVT